MEFTVYLNGAPVRRSRNLAGILRYAREASTWVDSVAIDPLPQGEGGLVITWGNGAMAETTFACFSVLCDWLCARRSWWGARLTVGSTPCGELGRDNPKP